MYCFPGFIELPLFSGSLLSFLKTVILDYLLESSQVSASLWFVIIVFL